jgi:hypothetical protein
VLVGDQIGAHKFLSGGIQPIGRHGEDIVSQLLHAPGGPGDVIL